jgi:hypothetical protein
MAEELTAAELLQDRLTEFGLVRVLSRQDVSPEIVKELPLEEAARHKASRHRRDVEQSKRLRKSQKQRSQKRLRKRKRNGGLPPSRK